MSKNDERFCFKPGDVSTVCERDISLKIAKLKQSVTVVKVLITQHFATKMSQIQLPVLPLQCQMCTKEPKFCYKRRPHLPLEAIEVRKFLLIFYLMEAVRGHWCLRNYKES